MDDQDKMVAATEEASVAAEPAATPIRTLVELAVATALLVSVVFQAKTMAYNNYSLWRLEFTALEFVVALASACVVRVGDIVVPRGEQWASSYVSRDSGWLWSVLANLLPAAVCAAVMTALLSMANVLVVAQVFYRETVEAIPLAILMRFLADLPTAFVVCLAVRLAYPHVKRRWEQRRRS